MKAKIKVKVLTPGCLPVIIDKGDWIDLKSAVSVAFPASQSFPLNRKKGDDNKRSRDVVNQVYYIPLGVAMELPAGYEAIVVSRSSTPKKFKAFCPNAIGVIDNSYKGNDDEWIYICSALDEITIEKFDRICQFRIQLSQKATLWQKIKWLFTSGVEIVEVDNLNNTSRGGLGSTGKA